MASYVDIPIASSMKQEISTRHLTGGWKQYVAISFVAAGIETPWIDQLRAGDSVIVPPPDRDCALRVRGFNIPDFGGWNNPSTPSALVASFKTATGVWVVRFRDGKDNSADIECTITSVARTIFLDQTDRAARGTTLSAAVTFSQNGEGTLTFGDNSVPCLGNPEVRYTNDVTVDPSTDKFPEKYSSEFGVTMKWAVLLMWKRGIYFHAGENSLESNGGPTAGCIHLAEGDAKTFYDFIDDRIRVVVAYPW